MTTGYDTRGTLTFLATGLLTQLAGGAPTSTFPIQRMLYYR